MTHPYPTARTTPQLSAMHYTSTLTLTKSPPWAPSWAPSRPPPPLHPMGPRKPPMTRPKKDTDKVRVITDLSMPAGYSVNDFTPTDTWDSAPFKLTLATARSYADTIAAMGRGVWMSKVDLRLAYKQLPIDPLDYPLTGIKWRDRWYYDTRAQFGGRWGAAACQRTTEGLAYICRRETETPVYPYIDDMGTLNVVYRDACKGHTHLLDTIEELGLEHAPDKTAPPSQKMTFVGISFDTLAMIMSVDPDKVTETLDYCRWAMDRQFLSEKELQSLVGKLYHVSVCSPGAERFINRLRCLLSEAASNGMVCLTQGVRLDLAWFIQFLPAFNGKAVIRDATIDLEIAVDSCLTGGGDVSPDASYIAPYGPGITDCAFSISSLEAFNLLTAVRLWAGRWSGKNVLAYVNNMTTVCVMESGRADDPLLQAVAREIWWHCATLDVALTVRHRPGAQMGDPDALSRFHTSPHFRERVGEFVARTGKTPVTLTQDSLPPPMLI